MGEAQATAPRRTLFEVEREKRWRIWMLFSLLLGLVFAGAWVACLIVSVCLYMTVPVPGVVAWVFTLRGLGLIFGLALAVSLLYWLSAQVGARRRLLTAMHGRPLDPGDRYHERLANVVEEMRIATGAPRIECVTVRTVGLNAFAFSDLHGGGVIGVTEGALARLSRQQLQAVVAHEFAHILSGSYATVTVSCLLFGVYSALGEGLEDAMLASAGVARAVPLVAVGVGLRGWLWMLQVASTVTSAALSREREWQADLAAARYTRDPLSLAEALRIIGRHPGGAGSIPEGLSPLCIRATGSRAWPAVSWTETHPPLEERIAALLRIAHVGPAEFERQAAAASERFDGREHVAPGPATTPTPPVLAAAAPLAAALGVAAAPVTVAPVAAVAGPVSVSGAAPAGAAAGAAGMTCPSCGAGLQRAVYEGIDIAVCKRCGGRLVTTPQVGKLLARREVSFTEEQERIADLLTTGGDSLRRAAVLARGRPGVNLIPCPRCGSPMMRRHYDYEHAVEIDYCVPCDLIWFEKDELEALQILVERATG